MMRISRSLARSAQLTVDVGALACAYFAAFLVRFEGGIPPQLARNLMVSLPLAVGLQMAVLTRQGVHKVAWRYISLVDARRIASAIALATLILLGARAFFGSAWFAMHVAPRSAAIGYASSPIGVLLADAVFATMALIGTRALWRVRSESEEQKKRIRPTKDAVPTILVGAGRAGALVAREIQSRPDLGLEAVAFVDDDAVKTGTQIAGVPVLGRSVDIESVARKVGAKQVVIAMASAPGREIRRVMQICERASLPVKIVPGLFELIGGSKVLAQIRDVSVEDLLRREPADLDNEAIRDVVQGKVVAVTGAGGSIGSELCRQVARFAPLRLVLIEQAETSLFFIHRELRKKFPSLDVVPCIADICDSARIEQVFSRHRPKTIFHAAAHKHVPMMEANAGEAVKNNIFGTMLVADAADRYGASEFVMISTDKAVNPVSVMGATKRAAEVYVQALSARSKTRFVAVRFGNVLGSAGSVVPIFREQIATGGPVTITHPDMKRYFMTIPEAVQLVLQAAAIGRTGEIMILDMGEPVRLVDLAQDLIRLSGLRVGEDIDIVFTGMRPGERLFEELSTADEAAEKTRHPRIFVGRIKSETWLEVNARFARFRTSLDSLTEPDVRAHLRRLVPEYTPASAPQNDANNDALALKTALAE